MSTTAQKLVYSIKGGHCLLEEATWTEDGGGGTERAGVTVVFLGT